MSRLEQLASGIQLGDDKPSHMLSRLQRTNATTDKSLLRDFWLKRLPQQARLVLTGVEKSRPNGLSLEELAVIADDIMESLNASSTIDTSIAAIGNDQHSSELQINAISSPFVDRIKGLEKDMANLKSTLSRIESKLGQSSSRHSRSQSRSDNRSRQRSNTPAKNQSKDNFSTCWFHYKFGNKANKCESPCDFNSKNE